MQQSFITSLFVGIMTLCANHAFTAENSENKANSIIEHTQKANRQEQILDNNWSFKIADSAPITVKTPHTWNAIDAADGGGKTNSSVDGKFYFRGNGVYTTTLSIKKEDQKRYFLRFDGASILTKVKINDQFLGEHNGAFGAFTFEITDKINHGDNKLVVETDNTFDINVAPSSGDFSNFGGLYRPVFLVITSNDCISPLYNGTNGMRIWQESLSDSEGKLKIKVNLSLKGKEGDSRSVEVSIRDAENKLVSQSGENVLNDEATVLMSIPNPIRWNGMENPYLYTVEATLKSNGVKVDSVCDTWGFRTIEISPSQGLILNGKPIKMHGVNRHQDKEGMGWARSYEDQLEDVKLIKEIGANCVRLAHYMHAPIMYKALEKEGIIIYAEAPIIDRTNDTKEFTHSALQQLTELIEQHQNRAAIAMWSISNELRNGPNGQTSKGETELMKKMYNKAKELDPTRYVVQAANSFQPSNEIVDHIAFNTYPGWYGGNYYELTPTIEGWQKRYPKKGIAISEYGAGGGPNTHEYPLKRPATVHPWHPEEFQNMCHEQQWRSIKNSVNWGSYVWNMFDFGADERREGEHLGRNDKGLISYDRKTKKDAFFFYKANWTNEPMVHITSKRFSPRNQGLMPIKIYSNCDTVKLYKGNRFIGESKGDDCGVFMFDNVWFDRGKQTIRAVAQKGDKMIEDTTTIEVK